MKHWKNINRRGLALILALLMCMNMLSLSAFAAEESPEITEARAALEMAQTAYDEAKADYDAKKAAYDEAHAAWQAAKAELEADPMYQAYLEYAELATTANKLYNEKVKPLEQAWYTARDANSELRKDTEATEEELAAAKQAADEAWDAFQAARREYNAAADAANSYTYQDMGPKELVAAVTQSVNDLNTLANEVTNLAQPMETAKAVMDEAEVGKNSAQTVLDELLAAQEPEEPETGGWYQDTATVKGADAVCEMVNGELYLKAGSSNGNGHDSNAGSWPAMFINDELSAKLYDGVAADATKFVELTFTPVSEAAKSRFGVYINYTNPANGFFVGYDADGWFWETYSAGSGSWYGGDRVTAPAAGTETTLRIEWTGTKMTLAQANGANLFGDLGENPFDFSAANNAGTKLGIKCAAYDNGTAITEVNISSIDAGVVKAEEPEPELPEPDFKFPTVTDGKTIVYQQVKSADGLLTNGELFAFVDDTTYNNSAPRILYHASGTGRTDQLEVTVDETLTLNHNNTAFTKENQLWSLIRVNGGYKLKSWADGLYLTTSANASTPKQLSVDATGSVFTLELQSDGRFYVKSGDKYLEFNGTGGDGWKMVDTASALKLYTPVLKDIGPGEGQMWAYVAFDSKWGMSTQPYTLKLYQTDGTTEVTNFVDGAYQINAPVTSDGSARWMHVDNTNNKDKTNQCKNDTCGTGHEFQFATTEDGYVTIKSVASTSQVRYLNTCEVGSYSQIPLSATATKFVVKKVDGGFTIAAIVDKPIVRTEEATITRTGTGASSPIPTAATGSNRFRIPALTTLSNGWVVAAADVRWNHNADNPGNLDTIVSVSKDGGQTWDWEIVNYFGDYAPSAHDALSASFIDPALVQDPGTGKLWMFIDVTAANGKYGKGSTGFTDDGCLLVAHLPDKVGQRAPETPASYIYCVSADTASVTYEEKTLRAIVSVADRTQASGYYVDAFMDLYRDGDNGVERVMCDQQGSDKLVQCNLFYKQSEWKVYPTGYLMLRSASVTDTGLVWDDPIFPADLRGEIPGSRSGFFGVCPGRGTITETGRIVFPVYDAAGANGMDGDNHNQEFASVIYSDDHGATWHRSDRATSQGDTGKASESQIVVLPDGSLRMYSRNSIGYIGYTDSADNGRTWGTYVRDTNLPYVGNCMISFINVEGTLTDASGNTYENLILGSYPKGSGRANGVVRIGYVDTQAEGQPVVWLNTDDVRYSGYFAYSCLTQLQVDGKPSDRFGIFYEGTSGPITYATMTAANLLGDGWTLGESGTTPEPDYDGECGAVEGTVFYKLNGTELHIWGNGAMKDWNSTNNMPWSATKLTSIVIDEGVTTVGLNAFKMGNSSELVSVSLPEGLTKIGGSAFYHCYRLKEITIPSTVTSIGSSAFYKCTGLGNVTLPAGLTELSDSAFNGCEGFTEITIPEGLTKIGDSAFGACSNVTTVDWGGVKEIGKNAFAGTGLTSVVLPETVTILDDSAFYGCNSLTSIVIPDDVALRNTVFQNCYALQNVVLLGEPHLTYTDKVGYGESSNSVFQGIYNTNPLFIYASGDAWMAKLAKLSTSGVNTYYIANLDGGTLTGTFETGKLAAAEKEGYTFQGWQDAEGNGLTADTAKGTVFTAKWEAETPKPDGATNDDWYQVEETEVSGSVAPKKQDGKLVLTAVEANGNNCDGSTPPAFFMNDQLNEAVAASGENERTLSFDMTPNSTTDNICLGFGLNFTDRSHEVFIGYNTIGKWFVQYYGGTGEYPGFTAPALQKGQTYHITVKWTDEKITLFQVDDTVCTLPNDGGFGGVAVNDAVGFKCGKDPQSSGITSMELSNLHYTNQSSEINTGVRKPTASQVAQILKVEMRDYYGDHDTKYELTAADYTLGSVTETDREDYPYTCELTLTAGVQGWIDRFNADKAYKHELLRNDVGFAITGGVATLYYSAEAESWTIPPISSGIEAPGISRQSNGNFMYLELWYGYQYRWLTHSGEKLYDTHVGACKDGNHTPSSVTYCKTIPASYVEDGKFYAFTKWKTPAEEDKGLGERVMVYQAQYEVVESLITNEDGSVTIPGGTKLGATTIPMAVKSVTVPSMSALADLAVDTSWNKLILPEGSTVLLPDGSVVENEPHLYCFTSGNTYEVLVPSTGRFLVSGTGAIADYSERGSGVAPWSGGEYRPKIKTVEVMDGVTGIGKYAFSDIDNMTSVTLPDSVTTIGANAFKDSDGLAVVTAPGVTRIDTNAFSGCVGLNTLVFGAAPETVSATAFVGGRWSSKLEDFVVYVNGVPGEQLITALSNYDRCTYNIVNINGGEITRLNEGSFATLADREGLTFLGWFDENDEAVNELAYDNTVYTAKWQLPTYTVTFIPGYGILNGDATITVEEGKTIETLPTATRSGYAFKGWFNGSDEFTTETPVTGDITVTAKWVQTFNVTIEDGHGGDIFKTIRISDVETGTYLTVDNLEEIIAKGEELGWKFLGWAVQSSSNPVKHKPGDQLYVNRNFTKFIAKWELIPTTPVFTDVRNIRIEFRDETNTLLAPIGLTTEQNGNGTLFTLSEVIANDGTNAQASASVYPYQCTLTLNAQAIIEHAKNNVGVNFGVRVLDGEANPQITLYCRASDGRWATWVDGVGSYSYVVNYTINVKLPIYTITVDGTEHTVNHGDTLTGILPENPTREGYTFVGWFDGEDEVTAETVVTGEMTITAKWELNKYTVTLDLAGGTINGEGTLSVEHGKPIGALPTPTRSGYTFVGWFDGETEVTADTVVTGEMTVTARWSANPTTVTRYTLTINYVDESGNTVAPSYTQRLTSGSSYNVASPAVEGMDPDQAEVSGRLTRNTTVTVTYTAQTNIDEPDVPLADVPVSEVFADINADDWYTEAIQFVYGKGLMDGVTPDRFEPGINITRGGIVTILYRLEGEPDAGKSSFPDVAGTEYEKAVAWATEQGIVKGYGNGMFGPEDYITREQLSAVLYRYSVSKGYDVSGVSDLLAYTDAEHISEYAVSSMSWANAAKLIIGNSKTTLNPLGNTTRAEAAMIFMRFYQTYTEAKDIVV